MMKIAILALMTAALLLAQKKDQPAPPRDTTQAAASQSIPKGAVLVEPNLYRFTDAAGKNWFYRQTPFGISKWEDKPSTKPAVEEKSSTVVTIVKDLGDSVQFERPTPFGVAKWVRLKSELTSDEKALLESQRTKTAEKP